MVPINTQLQLVTANSLREVIRKLIHGYDAPLWQVCRRADRLKAGTAAISQPAKADVGQIRTDGAWRRDTTLEARAAAEDYRQPVVHKPELVYSAVAELACEVGAGQVPARRYVAGEAIRPAKPIQVAGSLKEVAIPDRVLVGDLVVATSAELVLIEVGWECALRESRAKRLAPYADGPSRLIRPRTHCAEIRERERREVGVDLKRRIVGVQRQQLRQVRGYDRGASALGREALMVQRALIASKEEQPVFDNRSANRSSEDVYNVVVGSGLLSAALFYVIQRVKEVGVAMKLKAGAVELIRARLGHDVYDCALIPTVLSREVVGDDLELGDRVCIVNEERGPADRKIVVIPPVYGEVVRARSLSVD